jgi:hypothetical protein
MQVIRLANGNLLVPEYATSDDGQVMSDAYIEVSPADADYERFAAGAISQQDAEEQRQRWRAGDESLRRQFLEFLARRGQGGPLDERDGGAG